MLKITGALILLVCSTIEGFRRCAMLYKRRQFIEDFIGFLNILKTKMRFSMSEIKQLISDTQDFPTLKSLYSLFPGDNNVPLLTLWKSGIKKCAAESALSKADVNFLCEFALQLGSTDLEGQTEHIELYCTLCERRLNEAENDIKQKSKLYRMLGFFAGAAAALVII